MGAPSLAQVDGGAGYYGLFANGLSTSAGYFPVGVWGAYDFTAANVARDKAVGLNLYVWNADVSASNQQNIAAAGMRTLQNRSDATTNVGAHTAGFVLGDEIDMSQVPSVGLATMQSAENQVRGFAGGRALYANYGKGVLFGWGNGQRISEGDRARYVNDFQELVSSDFYWFTDPWQSNTPADPWLPESRTEADGTISGSQVRRASNYGYQLEEMRRLDALDGQRKPIWAFVEVGSPFTPGEGDGIIRQITPAQIRAAVWHSLIAGARGVIYFQHSFSGPNMTHHALRDPRYQPAIDTVTSVNAQITNLAPVLNAPTVTSHTTTSSGVRALYKWHDGHFYVLAGNRDHTAQDRHHGPALPRQRHRRQTRRRQRTDPRHRRHLHGRIRQRRSRTHLPHRRRIDAADCTGDRGRPVSPSGRPENTHLA